MATLHNMHMKSIDFIQPYAQAKVRSDVFLHPPPGFELSNNDNNSVLRLKRNLYGLKDTGRTWHEHLTDGLTSMGFSATASDPCIFVRGSSILILYVDDCVILTKTEQDTNNMFEELTRIGFKLMDEGSLEEYLGLSIKRKDKTFTMS